ncbi:MAG TPA: hypothetical protein VKI65_13630 [Gemmataceae bacterium]|nr:hypothetical protein [Gemmataceae bacterium]
MSRYRFELATPADDADLRAILAATPMPGPISVTFRREPSYFEAAVVEGGFRQVVACRDTSSRRLVGFGARAIREVFVNGRATSIGYLSSLRLLEPHRNQGLVARGYAFFRRLHTDNRTPLYLTTIAAGNARALAILTAGRAGLPAYHYSGDYQTAAIAMPAGKRRPLRSAAGGKDLEIRLAKREDLAALMGFLQDVGPRRQFFPCYTAEDFFTEHGTFRGLHPQDILLAYKHGRLVGTLAGWDQQSFRQTVVEGYQGVLRCLRPVYNCWARLRRHPRLSATGESIRYVMAALLAVADDNPAVFRALLEALLGRVAVGRTDYLLIGLHEADPLLPVVRAYRPTWYTTRLYIACWEDGEKLRAALDSRCPYLELGCL